MKLSLIDAKGNRIKGGDDLFCFLVRRLSLPLAGILSNLGINPIWIVFLSFFVAVCGAFLVVFCFYSSGAILFALAWYLDFVDGDIARLTHKVSKIGAFFDSLNGKCFLLLIIASSAHAYFKLENHDNAWFVAFWLLSGLYLFSSMHHKFNELNERIRNQAAGFRCEGEYIQKPLYKFAIMFFLSGYDFLLVFMIVFIFFRQLDIALIGGAAYCWLYVSFKIYHSLKGLRHE